MVEYTTVPVFEQQDADELSKSVGFQLLNSGFSSVSQSHSALCSKGCSDGQGMNRQPENELSFEIDFVFYLQSGDHSTGKKSLLRYP